jgi:hypothetical protein
MIVIAVYVFMYLCNYVHIYKHIFICIMIQYLFVRALLPIKFLLVSHN